MIHEGKGDCDCFVVLLSSLLTNQKIPHSLRVIKQHDDAWTHIYIVVPNGSASHYTLDCVTDKFNSEPFYSQKKDFNMALEYLDGINTGNGQLGEDEARCKPKLPKFTPLIPYYDTMDLKNRGFIPTVEMLKENDLKSEYVENESGVGHFVVETPTGVKQLPTILTREEADQFVSSAQTQPVQQDKILASSDIQPLVKPATLGWVALAAFAVTMLWPSTPKPVLPAPKLSGVTKPASARRADTRTKQKTKIQTFTI